MIATLERLFESDEIPPAEDVDLNELRIASTLNGRVVVRGDFDALTGEMLLSALSNLTMPTPAPDGTPDSRSAAKRTADGFTELIRRYLDCAKTGTDGGQRPHVNVHINARDLAEHRDCAATPTRPMVVEWLCLILMSGTCRGWGRCPCRRPGFSGVIVSCPRFCSTITARRWMRNPGRRVVTAEQRSGVDCPRQGLRVPRLHVCAGVDGCAPYPALGERWADGDEQPGPAVPFTSSIDAPEIRVRREMGNPHRCRQQAVVHPTTLDRPRTATQAGEHHLQNLRSQTSLATTEHGQAPHRTSNPDTEPTGRVASTTHDDLAGRKTDLPNNSQTCRARARSNLSRPAATGSPSALLMRYFTVFRCRFM